MPIEITFERDSVAAGDDAFSPNPATFSFEDGSAWSDVLTEGVVGQYLPSVFKSKTYWTATLQDQAIATIEHTTQPELQTAIHLHIKSAPALSGKVYFRYDRQEPVQTWRQNLGKLFQFSR